MFIDENSDIDREALRTHVFEQLSNFKRKAHQLTKESDSIIFWNKVHDSIITSNEKEKDKYLGIISQINSLPDYIQEWISKSVDTPERFEFFIGSKAEEIASGDETKDYFWAMQIRHDQLIAVTRVISILLVEIEKWLQLDPRTIHEEAIFQGLCDYSIDDQIYLEAENIHKARQDRLKN